MEVEQLLGAHPVVGMHAPGAQQRPHPFSRSKMPVKPHSSPGSGPRLHSSTIRRSPAGWCASPCESGCVHEQGGNTGGRWIRCSTAQQPCVAM
jgi:hypothetical protein